MLAGRRVVVAGTGPFLLPVAAGLAAGGRHGRRLCIEADQPAWAALRQPALDRQPGASSPRQPATARVLARHRVPMPAPHDRGCGARRRPARARHRGPARRGRALVPGSRAPMDCRRAGGRLRVLPPVELPREAGARLRRHPDGPRLPSGRRRPAHRRPAGCSPPARCHRRRRRGACAARRADRRARGRRHGAHRSRPACRQPRTPRCGDSPRRCTPCTRCPPQAGPVCSPTPSSAAARRSRPRRIDAAPSSAPRDARTVKLLSRAGMGWCQGRDCGSADQPPRRRACRTGPDGDPDSRSSGVGRPGSPAPGTRSASSRYPRHGRPPRARECHTRWR